MNKDLLEAAAIAMSWGNNNEADMINPEVEAVWFREAMIAICNVAMPRVKAIQRDAVSWWTDNITMLRERCSRSRREYTRSRRRRRATVEETERLYAEYRISVITLHDAISEARTRSCKELLDSLNRDPWGRPYKTVLCKLRPWVPPLTETLDTAFVETVVDTLFPKTGDSVQTLLESAEPNTVEWTNEYEVAEDELNKAILKLKTKNTAPGPDGIPGKVWGIALPTALGDRFRTLMTSCFRNGIFPKDWKKAKLVLLKKPGRPADSPAAYRPICLLDEAGKLFERIIAARLIRHLEQVGPNLSDQQFGFRRGRSTIDAIFRVREIADNAIREGRKTIAVSLDIVNAFNSLPWCKIKEALIFHNVPTYLHRIVEAYLTERSVEYIGKDGALHTREMYCGVPQGSVLGPLLWNLAYDVVLRMTLPKRISLVCYADDTLILAEGVTFNETNQLAELGVAHVVSQIHGMGLKTAPQKTEALWFHRNRRGAAPDTASIKVGDTVVEVGKFLKYLGLTLDTYWRFDEHFTRIVPRIKKVAGALQRLLPNLGGPNEEVRLLYAGVIRSMALYGAPVWYQRLTEIKRNQAKYKSVQRLVAIRIARGYRTISYEAATLIARFPPLDILAEMDARVYQRLHCEDGSLASWAQVRKDEYRKALERWQKRLSEPQNSKQRAVGAILPSFHCWLQRKERVTFRMTQIITGHGCFSAFLHKIKKVTSAQCLHCGEQTDCAQHTLEVCPAWNMERKALIDVVGQDLAPRALVSAILLDNVAWNAAVEFCEKVISQKEIVGRARESTENAETQQQEGGEEVHPPLTLELG